MDAEVPIILSILTPAVPSRVALLQMLMRDLEYQIGDTPVEHLVLMDNKRRTVGDKRDALLRMARGKYVAFVDDDDGVSDDYVAALLEAASGSPDVITFRQHATVNGDSAEIEFRLGNPNEPFFHGAKVKRNAWHVCAWRRDLAIMSSFPAANYGEDWAFAQRLVHIPNLREVHIPNVLHFYRHSKETTEAPA